MRDSAALYFVSFLYLFIFTSFNGANNLTSHIYDEIGLKNLGQLNLFTIYAAHTLGQLLAAYFKQALKQPKNLIVLGCFF